MHPSVLSTVLEKSGLPASVLNHISMADLVNNLREAKSLTKHSRLLHAQLTESYLEKLAESVAHRNHQFLVTEADAEALAAKMALALRNLISREQKRRAVRRISLTLNPNLVNRSGLSRVDVPSSDTRTFPLGPDPKTWAGSWTPITSPTEITAHVCVLS